MSAPPPVPGKPAGLAEYLKRAFLYRWNMLIFAGGAAASVLSPWPDALLALVLAGELVYLTQLVSSTRFRKAIDAAVYNEGRQNAAVSGQRSLQELVSGLSSESKRRFEQLRARCLEMRAIAHGVRGRTGEQGEDLSTSALDRLLWVFLRLLVSQEALQRFLLRTDVNEIRARLEESRARLEAQKGGDERVARSLADSVAAQEMRLGNYDKAQANADFVRIELDRIEAKIQALTEAAVNRQDPNFLSGQIDSVSESMHSTEKAISELQQITGLMDEMQEPPPIMEADLPRVTQR
ncbi:MAG TPA: hypothetical protein VFL57_21910 [Bryobacteraceae bacterium]|nr:hypothetical protein [Bryobacteraceae bacterium]